MEAIMKSQLKVCQQNQSQTRCQMSQLKTLDDRFKSAGEVRRI